MTILTILILAASALLLGVCFRSRSKGWVLMIASILAIYWLQPSMPIRNLDFWLPTATLALVCCTWVITAAPGERSTKLNLISFAVIAGLILLIGLTRYLSQKGILTPSQPPPIWQIFIVLVVLAVVIGILLKLQKAIPVLLWIGFAFLLGIFIVLKFPWLTGQASAFLRSLMGQSAEHASALDIRWLGFSYIAFRLIHTIRDRQSGRLPQVNLQEYVVYIIFFPAFAAGPIDRIERFVADLRRPVTITLVDFGEGGKRFVVGLFKKFVLADGLALIALNATNALQLHNAGWTWILLYAYTFQIYFDFSGYTDIAIGMAHWLGIRLPENFDHPYLQPNLTQFWNRWHMTLTQWFRAYFFNPVTRSLRSAKRTVSPTLVIFITQVSTMVLIGLWHGITLNFVFWGLWHGLGLFIQNRWSAWVQPVTLKLEQRPVLKGIVRVVNTLITFNYVALGWVWFALPSPQTALTVFSKLVGR